MWRRLAIACVSVAMVAAPASGAPRLHAKPVATTVNSIPAGISSLADGTMVYRPAKAGPLPLLVLLHGAGGNARQFAEQVEPIADRLGFMIVAPQSAGVTWDYIETARYGPDVKRIDADLSEVFARAAVPKGEIVIAGFSDGASYALAMGLSNSRLFSGIVAMSAGMMRETGPFDWRQRVFVAHGWHDQVLPMEAFTTTVVPRLRDGGVRLRFEQFNGAHSFDPALFEKGLLYAFGEGLG